MDTIDVSAKLSRENFV